MPRVKMVYQEHGEWAPAKAQLGVCKHPRERLRFDGSFSLPRYMYCRDCGTRYLSPFHGMTQEEIDKRRARARRRAIELGFCDEDGNPID